MSEAGFWRLELVDSDKRSKRGGGNMEASVFPKDDSQREGMSRSRSRVVRITEMALRWMSVS